MHIYILTLLICTSTIVITIVITQNILHLGDVTILVYVINVC